MGASTAWLAAAALLVAVVGLAAAVFSSEAYVFYPGGRDGWVLDPSESYNHWAGRNRFQVNDTIVFAHEEGVSSVLLVTEQDFDTCSTRSPVRRLDAVGGGGGRSVFRFDRSGPFFFISSDEDRCRKAQKLYIIVMAVRPPVAVAPAPGSSRWTASPPAGAAAPPPLWASAPEYARGPGMSALGASDHEGTSLSSTLGAPPPTAGAPRSANDAIIGSAVGVVGALVLCML
ncbi:hypothetical protein GQ55_5G160500 [Panicum hallii var. hallii]|uniref:Phytocyanin domain-containing protein n=1 Tax=Panicum hallii var. hallii TaxID=1504633 RepID=A0A2T7DGV6_9POAL|nr:hypothetical protein GQ55_5G160500 [Panicum hallii var. hallii]